MSQPKAPIAAPEEARPIVRDAIARYCAARRARIAPFIESNYSLPGAARLHRAAFGWDMARAPANLALSAPHLASRIAASAAHRAGWRSAATWLGTRRMFLRTDVAREIEWRLYRDLLELPYAERDRSCTRDALAEEILADPRLDAALHGALDALGHGARSAALRAWLEQSVATYESTRISAADLSNALLSAGAGGLAFKKLTPGMMSLGPVAAQALVQSAAIASFPLGASAGALWYGLFPAAAPAALSIALTGGLMALAAVLAAFSGVVTDPIQRRLGIHRRRLERLVDCLERELAGEGQSRFTVRDHYVARLLDLVEGLSLAWRAAS